MENKKFKKLRKRKSDRQIKEEYMRGLHGSLTDRQLGIICEGSDRGYAGVAFRYKPKKTKEEESKKGFSISGEFKKKEVKDL